MADELQKQLQTLQEAIDSFPVGAVVGRQHSLEDKIAKTVNAITLTNSRLLLLKARDAERERSKEDEGEVNLSDLPKILDEYEEEISKIVLRRSLWKTCLEATALGKLIMNDDLPDTQVDHLLQITHLLSDLRTLLTEHKRIIAQTEVKKKELQQKLHDYKKLLAAQEIEQQEQATGVQRQNMQTINHFLMMCQFLTKINIFWNLLTTENRSNAGSRIFHWLKARLLKKLEKLNVMRILMLNLLTLSEVDYLKHSKWKDFQLEKQHQITLEELDTM